MAVSMDHITEELRNKGYQELADQLRPGGPMDSKLYEAAKSGNTERFQELAAKDPNLLRGVTPLKDTAIHIALRHGRINFALEFCKQQPAMLLRQNLKGGTPLHCALKSGQYSFFIQALNVLLSHSALRCFWDLEFSWMILARVSTRESLLYVAADVRSSEAVKKLLTTPLGRHANGPKGWNALHAAIFRNDYGIASQLLERWPKLSEDKDDSGNIPLHYAVYSNKYEMVELLLKSSDSTAYIINMDGLTPVHIAASLGLLHVFELMLRRCPDCGLMIGRRGSNALHLSVEVGARNIVDHILATPELEDLINERDEDGNTPLHLATMNRSVIMVESLCKDKRVDKRARNNEGFTVEDIDAKYERSRITQALRIPGASLHRTLNEIVGKRQLKIQHDKEAREKEEKERKEKVARNLKGLASSLSVVATLITTVTFAAAFTMPGGFKGDGPDQGMATLSKSAALKAFLISDTISMGSSMTAAFHLVWAGGYDDAYTLTSVISTSIFLMLMAIVSMGVAFATGVYVVIASQCLWLAVLVIAMTCAFTILMVWLGTRTLYKHAKGQKELELDATIISLTLGPQAITKTLQDRFELYT